MIFSFLILAKLLQCVAPFGSFQDLIPNGDNVPDPMNPGEIWSGVGHYEPAGGGARNPFGRDFYEAGKKWTPELCRKDSDKDGRTNGVELGDPNCTYTGIGSAVLKEGLTNPAICDPIDTPYCLNMPTDNPKYGTQKEWLGALNLNEIVECEALEDPEIRTAAVRFPKDTPVPAKQTTYMCVIFDLYDLGMPKDGDFHMVAVKPIIDNPKVVHHIALFACTGTTLPLNTAFQCGLLPSPTCNYFLNVWSIGLPGDCYHKDCGGRFGTTGFKYVAMQQHWTNDDLTPGLVDSSGLMLYYTPKLRPYDCQMLLTGSVSYVLPPKQESVEQVAECTSQCTKHVFKGPIKVVSAWNHMHKAGRKMNIQVLTKSRKLKKYLTDDAFFNYDTPKPYIFPEPVEIEPGDIIITNCTYSTIDSDEPIYWGDETFEEMCFGFVTYYPAVNAPTPFCFDKMATAPCSKTVDDRCFSLKRFIREITKKSVYNDVMVACPASSVCQAECVNTIIHHMYMEPCMSSPILWDAGRKMAGSIVTSADFMDRIMICRNEVDRAWNPHFYKNSNETFV